MEALPQSAPDFHVIRTYLEYILDLPWRKSSEEKLDLNEARKILDEDHYGLEDIKERILESLAVVKLRPDSKSPILLSSARLELVKRAWAVRSRVRWDASLSE